MSDRVLRRSSSEASFLTQKFPLQPCKVVKPCSMFVANLNSNLSNQELASAVADLFSQYGEITNVKVSRDSYNRPFAFVNFQNGEIISTILGKKHYLHSRLLRIERTKSHSTLIIPCISQLSYRSVQEIKSFLLHFGPIEKLNVSGEKLTCTFTTKQAAMNALLSLQNSGISSSLSKTIPGIVWVRNLPMYTMNEISDLFSPFGQIVDISPLNDSVFIKFKNFTDAYQSLSLDCSEWRSKILSVTLYDRSYYMYPVVPYVYYYSGYPLYSGEDGSGGHYGEGSKVAGCEREE